MIAFSKRNLTLFFNSKSNLFFSVMGALIAFVLYLVFLKNNLITSFPFKLSHDLLDAWVISGILVVTAVTTSLHALSQMITDREQGRLADFTVTSVPFWQLQASYLLCSFLISVSMQLFMGLIMYSYFAVTDDITIPWELTPKIILLACLSSFVWTTFNLLILSFVKQVKTLSQLGSIIGTASGFFAGVYMPIGVLPKTAQFITKLTPAPYNAALYRQFLLKDLLKEQLSGLSHVQRQLFEEQMGIRLSLNGFLSSSQMILLLGAFFLGFTLVAAVAMKHSRRANLGHV